MAKEKKPDFNAEEFIEQFRESAVPTYHRAPKKDAEGEADDTAKSTKVKAPKERKFGRALSELEQKLATLDCTKQEKDYVLNYIESHFKQVNRQGKQVYIRVDFIELINRINQALGISGSCAAYIDNVLTQHFSEHFDSIQGILDKCPPKF